MRPATTCLTRRSRARSSVARHLTSPYDIGSDYVWSHAASKGGAIGKPHERYASAKEAPHERTNIGIESGGYSQHQTLGNGKTLTAADADTFEGEVGKLIATLRVETQMANHHRDIVADLGQKLGEMQTSRHKAQRSTLAKGTATRKFMRVEDVSSFVAEPNVFELLAKKQNPKL